MRYGGSPSYFGKAVISSFRKEPGKVKKGKCTLVQALRLCTGRTAHSGIRGIKLLFLDHNTSRE